MMLPIMKTKRTTAFSARATACRRRWMFARATMKMIFSAIAMFLAMTAGGNAALRGYPSVPFVRIDPTDAACVYVKIDWHDRTTSYAASRDYGETFVEISQRDIPPTVVDQLWHGDHRYTRYGSAETTNPEYDRRTALFYSGDGGATWRLTALHQFIGNGSERIRESDRAAFLTQYGHRAPKRSRLWTPTFLATVFFLLAACGIMERRHGVAMLLPAIGKTLVAACLLYYFLSDLHSSIAREVYLQFVGENYWYCSEPWVPSLKGAVIMNIAANPLCLAIFLVVASPILPIGVHCITCQLRRRIGPTSRYGQWPAIIAVVGWCGIIAWVWFSGSLFR